jgi:hypothetical protein
MLIGFESKPRLSRPTWCSEQAYPERVNDGVVAIDGAQLLDAMCVLIVFTDT